MMYWNQKFSLFLIGILLISAPINPKAQLTFLYNGGRIGDVFTEIIKNIYLAQKYNLDLCINNKVPYLEHFTIDKIYDLNSLYKRKKILHCETTLMFARDKTVYLSHRATKLADAPLYNNSDCFDYLFKNYIENRDFCSAVTRYLSLKQDFEKPVIPEGHVSIALHVRKGSNFDTPPEFQQYRHQPNVDFFLKFPPEQYYIDQLTFLYNIVQPNPIYVRVFTDHKNPYELIDRMQTKLAHLNIRLDYQKPMSEIEDLYNISTFDFLIRPRSGFSIAAQIIGNHKAIIFPIEYQLEKNYLDVTSSLILIPDRKQYTLHYLSATNKNIKKIRRLLHSISCTYHTTHNLFATRPNCKQQPALAFDGH